MNIFSPKNLLLLCLIVLFAIINTRNVSAFGIGENLDCKAIGLISPSRAIKCMFAEYGITEEMVKENAKYLDVANYKYPYPQVTLTFSPTDPKPGEKVTAYATTTNFGNPLPDSLYFTWYLKKKDCTLNPPLKKNYNDPDEEPEDWTKFDSNRYLPGKKETDGRILDDLCNVNEDYKDGASTNGGIVNIEDYKVTAGRIYAGNGFESISNTYNNDTDSDGYEAILGGTDQKGKKTEHCFFHDVKAGKDYEFDSCFHLFPNYTNRSSSIVEETGDGSFGKNEEEFWHTNPADSDTAQTGHFDEANVAGLGAKEFTWTYQEGDKLGVAVEGISSSSTLFKDATYKIMWAIPGGTCEGLDEPGVFLDEDLLGEGEDYETRLDTNEYPDCPDGCEFTRILVKQKPLDSQQAPLSSYSLDSSQYFVKTEVISLPSRRRTNISASATGGTGGTAPTGGSVSVEGSTITLPFWEPGDDADPPCNDVDTTSLVSAGFFTQAQVDSDAKYRVVLSGNHSCCDPGYIATDELNPPDDPDDPSTWIDNTASCTTISSKIELVDSDDINTDSIFTLNKNKFNKLCLSKNLVSPTGLGENEPLNVTLSHTPENPTNDIGDGSNADTLSVNSIVDNPTNKTSLSYTWTLSAGVYSDPDATWYDLTKDQTNIEQTSGTGISNLKFKLNLIPTYGVTEYKYLKIKLNVSEAVSTGTRKGNSEVIIPLSSSSDRLSVYTLKQDFSAINITNANSICADSTACEVARNEIVGVRAATLANNLYSFYWTLDGEPLTYEYLGSAFSEPTNEAFFPILAKEGSSLNIELIATKKDSGQNITLTKAFTISEPSLNFSLLASGNRCVAKKLGQYKDLDDKLWDDNSQDEFECEEGNIGFKVVPSGYNAAAENSLSPISFVKRYYNGTELETDSSNEDSFEFSTDDDTGSSFSLSIEGVYTQSNAIKKALRDYWAVPIDSFYEKLVLEKIFITLVDSIDIGYQKNVREKILASMISGVPAYFSFLFRIALTAFVFLATTAILSSLFSNFKENV